MEAFIFILLMKYFLCFQIAHLESFSQTNSGPNLTNHYLDISEFDQNDVMHLSIIVYSGEMDKIIHYGFSDNTSIKSNLLTYTIDTTSMSTLMVQKVKIIKTVIQNLIIDIIMILRK